MEYESLEKLRQFSFGAFFALIIAFLIAAFVIDVDKYITHDRESFTLEGTYIRILKKEKLKWEVWTDEITVGKDGKRHDLKNIYKGIYYRKDKPPFVFSAARGTYNSETDEVVLEGNIMFDSDNGDYFRTQRVEWYGKPDKLFIPTPLKLRMDGNTYSARELTATGEDLDDMTLKNDVVVEVPDINESGSKKTKKEIAESGIEEKNLKKLVLRAGEIEYSGKTKFMRCFPKTGWKIIRMPGEIMSYDSNPKVTLTGEKFYIESYEMYMDFARKYARAVGDVHIVKKGEPEADKAKIPEAARADAAAALKKRDTKIETQEVYYYWKKGHVEVPGPMLMYQDNLDLNSGRAFLDSKNDTAFLSGGVRLHQDKGKWLEDEGIVREDAGDKTKEIARQDTVVRCKTMEMDFESEDLAAAGDVIVEQKDRRLLGSKAVYKGEEGVWTVYGGPVAIEDDKKITADMFKYNEEKKKFEALGKAYVEMDVDKDAAQELDTVYAERKGGETVASGTVPVERARVFSDDITYDEKADRVYANARARVLYRDIELDADTMLVDYTGDTASGTGSVILKDPETEITADTVYADTKEKYAVFTGNVLMKDKGVPETGVKSGREPFELEADTLKYYWEKKKGTATGEAGGRVRLRAADDGPPRWSIADRLDIDRLKKEYIFTGDVIFHQEGGGWLDKYGWFGDVDEDARRIAGKPTDITCGKALMNEEAGFVRFEDNVLVKQPLKQLRADSLEVDTRAKRLVAEGNVYVAQSSGRWLFDEGFIDNDAEGEVKKRLAGAVEITADRLESLYGKDEKKLLLEGNVRIVQGRARATADRMWRFGITKKTILEGNVKYKDEKGRTLSAERVVYDGNEKTLEAFEIKHGEAEVEETK